MENPDWEWEREWVQEVQELVTRDAGWGWAGFWGMVAWGLNVSLERLLWLGPTSLVPALMATPRTQGRPRDLSRRRGLASIDELRAHASPAARRSLGGTKGRDLPAGGPAHRRRGQGAFREARIGEGGGVDKEGERECLRILLALAS